MKVSLFNIEKEFIQIAETIIDNGGELDEETELALQINKEQLESKAVCYSFIVKDVCAEIDAIDFEIKRLQAMKLSRVKTVDKLKDKLTDAMLLFEVSEIKTPLIKINFRNSESIEITDESLLIDEFKTVKTTETPNKIAIKDAIKRGVNVLGAELKYNKNLQIK